MSHIDGGGDPNSVKAGRELADISIPALVHHGVYLVIVCVIVWFAMMGLFKLVIGKLQDRDPQVSALARPAGEAPPEPRLLTNEPLNLQQFLEQEGQRMDGYGYIDEGLGIVRLPIDRAKDRLLERGLPVRQEPAK
jgi:hypothetical protein